MADYSFAHELSVLAAREGQPKAFADELVVLVVCGTPPTRYIPATELSVLASKTEGKVVAKVTEVCVLISYAAEATEKLNSRSWGFNFDQHQFYVLHLGEQGTVLYDVLTQEWCQWQTEGFSTWNAEGGVEWNNEVYFGGREDNALWRMDPDSFLDEDFRTIRRVVTGGIPAEARNTLRSGMFVLSAIKEGEIDDESTPYVQLSISDDGGFTFKPREQIVLNDAPQQDFSWRGLGTIRTPGRIFKVEDVGGFVTIKGADQHLRNEEESDD